MGCRPPSNRRSKSRPLWGLLRVSKIEYDFTLSDSADERFAAGGSHSGGPFHPTVCCARCCYKPLIQSVLNASLREQFNSPAKPPALPERIEAARCIRRRVPVTSRLLGPARSGVGQTRLRRLRRRRSRISFDSRLGRTRNGFGLGVTCSLRLLGVARSSPLSGQASRPKRNKSSNSRGRSPRGPA